MSEVKTDEQLIAKVLNEYLPEYIRNYIDISTCSIMNMFRDKKSQPVRTLFQEKKEAEKKESTMLFNIVPGKKVQRFK